MNPSNPTTPNEPTTKQQASEKLRQAGSVLVTVSQNPNVDQLSAAIGLTLMLNRLGKHATAVFSGQIPDAMKFLEPEKTIDTTVDSLRDFIISLDKNKADKLRYKVEDDVVRVFITPYKTSLSEDDLQFTQGDFNVDVVVGLGVERREDMDKAIIAHGRILHDATVISVTCGSRPGSLGAINWHEPTASSLSEMLVSISESLQGGLLDPSISTALLTGIVSATERFSNDRTSPKVMTMAAQLMAAGANQQLIATNLQMVNKKSPIAGGKYEPKARQEEQPQTQPKPEQVKQPAPAPKPAPEQSLPVVEPKAAAPAPKPVPTPEEPRVDASHHKMLDGDQPSGGSLADNRTILEHKDGPVNIGQPAASTQAHDPAPHVDAARQAVEQAMSAQPFSPANQPLQSLGALPMPGGPQVLDAPMAPPLPPAPAPTQYPSVPMPAMPPAPLNVPSMPPAAQAFPMPPAQGASGQPPTAPPPMPPPF